jgi:hypothetical protein
MTPDPAFPLPLSTPRFEKKERAALLNRNQDFDLSFGTPVSTAGGYFATIPPGWSTNGYEGYTVSILVISNNRENIRRHE